MQVLKLPESLAIKYNGCILKSHFIKSKLNAEELRKSLIDKEQFETECN